MKGQVATGSHDRFEIEHRIHELLKQDARAAYADEVSAIKNSEEVKLSAVRASLDAQRGMFNEQRQQVRQMANEGVLTKQQEYQQLLVIAQQEAAAEIQAIKAGETVRQAALAAQLAAATKVGADTRKIWAEIVKDAATYTAQLAQVSAQGGTAVAKAQADLAKAMTDPMNKAIKSFSDGIGGQFAKLATLQQGAAATMRGVWQQALGSIESSFTNSFSRMLQTQLRNLLIGKAAEKDSAGSQVMMQAKLAAGKAYAATVGIPVIGPVLAPAAAATAFAGVMAFLPSAAKGWDTAVDLREKLRIRIGAVIGYGPHAK